MHLMKNLPFLLSCDLSGESYVWSLQKSLENKFKQVLKFSLKGNEKLEATIYSIAFSEELDLIFTGDDKGNLRALEMNAVSAFLSKINSNQNNQSEINCFNNIVVTLNEISINIKWTARNAHLEPILNISFFK